MATAITTERDQQYRLFAYVCGNSCVRHVDNIGTVTFTRIFVQRPDDCRYAIVGLWSIAAHGDEVQVLDLYEALEDATGHVLAPPPIWTGDCADAAIMATMMRYEES